MSEHTAVMIGIDDRAPLPAWQSIELGTADDPAAAALDVQRCSVNPAVLPGWRADCAPLPDLCVPFLYNAVVPLWRTLARNTPHTPVSVSGATLLSWAAGAARCRAKVRTVYAQNSDAGCSQVKILLCVYLLRT